MKERIQSLEKISHEALFEAFKEAFRDYEMQLSREEMLRMLKRRGFVPELSFGAFSGNRLVAFTFNGVGSFNGLHTAYDTGTGTIEDFRGSGLASRIFEYSIPHLKNAGISDVTIQEMILEKCRYKPVPA